jgi:hypothetical protein
MPVDDIPITVDLRAYYTIDSIDEEKAQENVKDAIISEYQSAKSVEAFDGLQNIQSKMIK